jgi:hypothetical protein
MSFIYITKVFSTQNLTHMHTTVKKVELEVPALHVTIQGELMVSGDFWRFTSLHPAFERIFPTTSVYSVSKYKNIQGNEQRIELQQAIATIVATLA